MKHPRVRDPENEESMLVFELAQQQYALPVMQVLEVVPRAALIQLPTAPTVLAGILRLRGTLLAVIDLRARLGLPSTAPEISHRIVITAVGTSSIGLLVDAVHDLRPISMPRRPADPAVPNGPLSGVRETADGVITLLDPDAIISADLAAFLATTLDWLEDSPARDPSAIYVSRGSQ